MKSKGVLAFTRYQVGIGFKNNYNEVNALKKIGLIFSLADFHGKNWRITGFDENTTQYLALFSTKTNQGWFYF